jgi:uncharacterized membrane protein
MRNLNSSTPRDSTSRPLPDAAASRRHIKAVSELEHLALARRSPGERWADHIANMAGKIWFAIVHAAVFGAWIVVNLGLVRGIRAFDPYPFQFLALVTSLEAIFLALFILTSQSRASAQADQRSHLDLQINLLAEAESTATLKMLRALCAHQGVHFDNDAEITSLLQETEPKKLLTELEKHLPDHS